MKAYNILLSSIEWFDEANRYYFHFSLPLTFLQSRSKGSLIWNHANVTNCCQSWVGFQHSRSSLCHITFRNRVVRISNGRSIRKASRLHNGSCHSCRKTDASTVQIKCGFGLCHNYRFGDHIGSQICSDSVGYDRIQGTHAFRGCTCVHTDQLTRCEGAHSGIFSCLAKAMLQDISHGSINSGRKGKGNVCITHRRRRQS
mmetsp:Transcript_25710/g.56381  ORF Transcript_25710/g.56381 Transcript_25710/m.56381 type:complete len:200 (-) Transcript_25710:931-1530(-)